MNPQDLGQGETETAPSSPQLTSNFPRQNVQLAHSPRLSAVPISPRTSFDIPRVMVPATAPLAPSRRRDGGSTPSQDSHQPETSTSTLPPPVPTAVTGLGLPSPSRAPPRPPRTADDSVVHKAGWDYPFPSRQAHASPPRPARPARPSEALMFAAPVPFPAPSHDSSQGPFPNTPEQQHGFENEGTYAETYNVIDFIQSTDDENDDSLLSRGSVGATSSRKASTKRKPVPRFLPSPEPAPGSSSSHPGHLSIGGFDALLARGEASAAAAQKRSAALDVLENRSPRSSKRQVVAPEVFSPRVGLGLADEGVEARDRRRALDEDKLRRGGWKAGQRSSLLRPTSGGGDLGEEKMVTWSDKLRQQEWRGPATPRQPHADSATPPSLAAIGHADSWRDQGPPTAALVHAHSVSRNPSADGYRHL